MHGGVVRDAHDVDVSVGTKTSTSGAVSGAPEITRRDVHTASSVSAQRRFPKGSTKKPNLAHQAALRRSSVKGKDVSQLTPPESSSVTKSKPVLVRAPSKTDMTKKPKPRIDSGSPKLPPLESFSIQDILASVGPEANSSIDAIAEICGRSKMSLAEEHASHRPPHVQALNMGGSPTDSLPSMRLEPVAEITSGPQTRSKSRSLALANASLTGDIISSDSTAAISNVTSHAHNKRTTRRRDERSSEPVPAPLLSQIFAWLRRSDANGEAPNRSDQDLRATRILQNMLSETDSVRS